MRDHEQKSGSSRWLSTSKDLPEETRLWRAVLGQSVADIYDPHERDRVIAWLRSRDFQSCCDFAQVPADDLKEQMDNLVRMPLPLARKYGKMLKHVLTSDIHD